MPYEPIDRNHEDPTEQHTYTGRYTTEIAFQHWIDGITDEHAHQSSIELYREACTLLEQAEVSVSAAEQAIDAYRDHDRIEQAGLFLSATYNLSDRTEFVYDMADTELMIGVGYRLAPENTLVLEEPVLKAGTEASGTVVNTTDMNPDWETYDRNRGGILGLSADGRIVNEGNCSRVAPNATGTVFQNGTAVWTGRNHHGTVINTGTVIGKLGETADGLTINLGTVENQFADGHRGVALDFGDVGDIDSILTTDGVYAEQGYALAYDQQVLGFEETRHPDTVELDDSFAPYLERVEQFFRDGDRDELDAALNRFDPSLQDIIEDHLLEMVPNTDPAEGDT